MPVSRTMLRRTAAVGLLLLTAAFVYFGLASPYLDAYRGYRDQNATLTERLQRLKAIAATRGDVMQRTRQLRASRELKQGFLNSKTPTLASAELQQYATRVINQSGGQLLSTQVVPPSDDGGLVAATVKIGMRGDSNTVQKLFYALERGTPVVVVNDLAVRNRARRGDSEVLDIRFALTAYVRPAAAPASPKVES